MCALSQDQERVEINIKGTRTEILLRGESSRRYTVLLTRSLLTPDEYFKSNTRADAQDQFQSRISTNAKNYYCKRRR